MNKANPFKYFKTSPEIIRLAVMYYVRYPLSFRQVEDILHDRGIDICHETVRYWVARFDKSIAQSIRIKRRHKCSNWQWHLDEVFVKINGEKHYLWRTVDHNGEVLECYVSKKRDKKSAQKLIMKSLKKHGIPRRFVTDKLRSYHAVLRDMGIAYRQITGKRLNNRCENSHCPFVDENEVCKSLKAS